MTTDTQAPLSAEGIAARRASALRLLADGVAMIEGESIGVLNARACADMLVQQATALTAAEARAPQAEAERDALNAVMDADAFSAIMFHPASGPDHARWECSCCGEDWETERHDPLAHDPLCPMRKVYSAALSASPAQGGDIAREGGE